MIASLVVLKVAVIAFFVWVAYIVTEKIIRTPRHAGLYEYVCVGGSVYGALSGLGFLFRAGSIDAKAPVNISVEGVFFVVAVAATGLLYFGVRRQSQ